MEYPTMVYCPHCGNKTFSRKVRNQFQCSTCDFQYFHNVASASGVFIECLGDVLLLVRARDPSKGKFDVPGGFVDPGESAESSAFREIEEELGCTLDAPLTYLGSWPNTYDYAGIQYQTCDSFFMMRLESKPDIRACEEELSGYSWIPISEIDPDGFAFPSTVLAATEFAKRFSS